MRDSRRSNGQRGWLAVLIVLTIAGTVRAEQAETAGSAAEPSESQPTVRVAALRYGQGRVTDCFSSGFLEVAARQAGVPVARRLDQVELGSEALFAYPFVVMGGEGAFALSRQQVLNLRAYLEQGGFVLASAACSDDGWGRSFRLVMQMAFPDSRLQLVGVDHPVFQSLFEIEQFQGTRRLVREAMFGLTVNGRLAVLFSPVGLHDSDYAGQAGAEPDDPDQTNRRTTAAGRCCCCGGNELRDAHLINANILIYALTH